MREALRINKNLLFIQISEISDNFEPEIIFKELMINSAPGKVDFKRYYNKIIMSSPHQKIFEIQEHYKLKYRNSIDELTKINPSLAKLNSLKGCFDYGKVETEDHQLLNKSIFSINILSNIMGLQF